MGLDASHVHDMKKFSWNNWILLQKFFSFPDKLTTWQPNFEGFMDIHAENPPKPFPSFRNLRPKCLDFREEDGKSTHNKAERKSDDWGSPFLIYTLNRQGTTLSQQKIYTVEATYVSNRFFFEKMGKLTFTSISGRICACLYIRCFDKLAQMLSVVPGPTQSIGASFSLSSWSWFPRPLFFLI